MIYYGPGLIYMTEGNSTAFCHTLKVTKIIFLTYTFVVSLDPDARVRIVIKFQTGTIRRQSRSVPIKANFLHLAQYFSGKLLIFQ